MKNYVDYHLNKFTNKYSDDFLFVSPWTGKPFDPPNLGKYLSQTGKMVVSSFYGYQGRHFCATGTLIKKWNEKHPDPIESTKNFMGHDRRKTTERYTALAEEYYEKYPYDWFKRILKGKKIAEENTLKNRNKAKIPSFHMETLREASTAPPRFELGSRDPESLMLTATLRG